MKIQTLLITLLLTFFSVSLVRAQEISNVPGDRSPKFKLTIKGIEEAKGEVRIAMFNSEEKYTKDPVYAVVMTVDEKECVWELESLPAGNYAIAVYHDKNENGKLDTNFLGIPKEDYGFSNNARRKFGPAKWDDAKFRVEDTATQIEIIIR